MHRDLRVRHYAIALEQGITAIQRREARKGKLGHAPSSAPIRWPAPETCETLQCQSMRMKTSATVCTLMSRALRRDEVGSLSQDSASLQRNADWSMWRSTKWICFLFCILGETVLCDYLAAFAVMIGWRLLLAAASDGGASC